APHLPNGRSGDLSGLLRATISELAGRIAATHDCPQRADNGDVVEFIVGQLARMPGFLSWGVRAATAGCWASAVFYGQDRGRQMQAWSRSRFAPCRDLMRFYSILAVLALYSRRP